MPTDDMRQLLGKIVSDGGASKDKLSRLSRMQSGVNQTGWIRDQHTWVYVSSSSFKIVGSDVTPTFQVGTKVCLKQGGGFKYFYVISSAFVTDTTVTVSGGDDYSLVNATITDNMYSYSSNPQGFPGWFTWTPTFSSTSATFTYTTQKGIFKIEGRMVAFQGIIALNGAPGGTTSNQLYFVLPFTSATITTYTHYFSNYWSIVTLGANMTQLLTYAGSNSNKAFVDATGSAQTRVHLTAAALGTNAVMGISGQFLI